MEPMVMLIVQAAHETNPQELNDSNILAVHL